MDKRTLATSALVAGDFYISYVAFGGIMTLAQQSVVFSMTIFIYLVIFYRRDEVKKIQTVVSQARGQAQSGYNAMPSPSQRQPHAMPIGQNMAACAAMTDELRVINRWLQKQNTRVQSSGVVTTPDYLCYNLAKTSSASWSVLSQKVLSDLAYEVFTFRGGGDPVTITFNEQPAYLRVTKERREVLPWAARLKGMAPYIAQVGASSSGTDMRLVKVNLVDAADNMPKDYLVGVFSSSGGGKSNVLRAMALSVLENSDPANTEFYFIDLDSNQFDSWLRLPHVRFVAGTEQEALALLNYLVQGMEGNRGMESTTRRFLVIDELQMLTAQSDRADIFCDLLGKLAQRWRKHGGCMLLATQDPTGDNYPTSLQRNTKVILAGLTEDASYLKRFLGVDGADQLRGDGDFIMKSAGRQSNFKAFLLTKDDITRTLDAIVSRWGEDYSTLEMAEDDDNGSEPGTPAADRITVPVAAKPKRAQVEIDADAIVAYLDEAYDFDAGALRKGWGVKLLEVLYGEPKPNAGNYKTRMENAVNVALTRLTNEQS
jgi:hypothetical protein